MKVLVTGANGFVGQHLTKQFAKKSFDVIKIVRKSNNLKDQDNIVCKDISSNTKWHDVLNKVDVVIHLAGRAHVMHEESNNPYALYRAINVDATVNLAKQSITAKVKRFIYISSVKVNGESTTDTGFIEQDKPKPKDYYGVTKSEAELALHDLCKNSAMELITIRPPLIYGPGVKANFLSLIKLCNKSIPLPFGAINNKRSYIYIDNLIAFIELCLTHPNAANQTFLVSDDDDQSTTSLIKSIKLALDKKPIMIPISKNILYRILSVMIKKSLADRLLGNLQVDISKAKTMLNWVPSYTFKEGITKTVAYYKKND